VRSSEHSLQVLSARQVRSPISQMARSTMRRLVLPQSMTSPGLSQEHPCSGVSQVGAATPLSSARLGDPHALTSRRPEASAFPSAEYMRLVSRLTERKSSIFTCAGSSRYNRGGLRCTLADAGAPGEVIFARQKARRAGRVVTEGLIDLARCGTTRLITTAPFAFCAAVRRAFAAFALTAFAASRRPLTSAAPRLPAEDWRRRSVAT
jgi:hypothetical protein